mgnify:FL=1
MPKTSKTTVAKNATPQYSRKALLASIAKTGKLYADLGLKRSEAVKQISKDFDSEIAKLRSTGILQAILAVKLSKSKTDKETVNAVLAKAFNYGLDERRRLSMVINSTELNEVVKGCKTPAKVLEKLGKIGLVRNGLVTKSGLINWLKAQRKKRMSDDVSVETELTEISEQSIQQNVKEAHKINNLRGAPGVLTQIREVLESSNYTDDEILKLLKVISVQMKSIENAVANEKEREAKKSKKK